MNNLRVALIDKTNGAATANASKLSTAALQLMAAAVQAQVNSEFAAEWGRQVAIRVSTNAADIQPGEIAYAFLATLPNSPGASAYHDFQQGVEVAFCAVTTCQDLYGPNGVSVDVSHEILETLGDEGANLFSYDGKGTLHALEMCDAVEVQTYVKTGSDGVTPVHVSNWLMRAWFDPSAEGPYDYMTSANLSGAMAPSGPMQTASGNGGNYQIVAKIGKESQQTALHIEGHRRKGGQPLYGLRAAKRLRHGKII